MKNKIWYIYFSIVVLITGGDLLIDTASPLSLQDIVFSCFKGITAGSLVMVLILLTWFLYKKISGDQYN